MIQWLSTMLRRPAYRTGPRLRGRRLNRTVNGKFLSFLEQSGFRRVNLDQYERSLRWRRVFVRLCAVAGSVGLAWVAIESAHALTLF